MTDQTMRSRPTTAEGKERTRGGEVFRARSDIYETKESLVLLMEMPGVTQESVNITLDKRVLTITGQKQIHTPDDFALSHAEFRVGEYERSFTISEMVDSERISATMKNGMLEVTLPKTQMAGVRRIPVQTA